MQPLSVVEDLYIVEDVPPCLVPWSVLAVMHKLFLQRTEEAFHWSVVPAVSLAAHADLHTVACEQVSVVLTGILAAAIRMVNQPRLPMAARVRANCGRMRSGHTSCHSSPGYTGAPGIGLLADGRSDSTSSALVCESCDPVSGQWGVVFQRGSSSKGSAQNGIMTL